MDKNITKENENCTAINPGSDISEIDEDSFVIVSSDDESLQVPSSSIIIAESNVQKIIKRIRNFEEIMEQLNIFKTDQTIEDLIVLFSCHGVRLYLNHPDGVVNLIHNNVTLRVIRFNETCTYILSFCLQIVDTVRNLEWIYPLDNNNLHCFFTSYGAFILPELPVGQRQHIQHLDGVTYGLVISQPANEIILEILESILDGTIREIPKDWDGMRNSSINVVSNSIVKNSNYISSGLISGAEKLGEYLGQGATLLKSNLDPTPVNQQPVVPEKLKAGIEVTKSVTGVAGNITGKCASAIGSATLSLGRYLAPHIQNKLPPLLSQGFGISQQTSEKSVNNVLAIAGSTVEGVSTIYSGIEQSVTILGKTVANNVVKIIEHKYGENCGSVAETTFDTAGNVINISQNVNILTPKGLVKKTAKNASIALVQEYKPTASTSNMINDEVIYPDLSGLIKELENDKINKID